MAQELRRRAAPAVAAAATVVEITVVARRVGSAGSRYVLLAYELAGD